jgi:predicted RND superfamily exporter protein
VVRCRWGLIIGTILVVLGAASGTRFLTINNDTRVFFSEENPQLHALEALERTYSKINTVFFAIAPRDGKVFTRETLAAIEELTEASWRMPHSSRVDSVTNFQHTRAEEDDLIVEDLVQHAISLSDVDLARIRTVALSEPQLVSRLVSPSGHVTGVNVDVRLPGESTAEVPEVAAFARKLADDFRDRYPGINLYLSGGVIADDAFGEASQHDMATLIPLMFLVLVIVVGVALRSFTGTVGTLVITLMSMVTGMGLAGWLRVSITSASANAPTIILTLAVADSVHILATLFQQMRLGTSKREAIVESLRVNLQPVFLTSVTTAIGFLTMNFSDAPPFRDLGNIVTMGVIAALVYSTMFLPALVAVLPVRVKPRAGAGSNTLDWFADFVISRRITLFWGMAAMVVILTAGMLRLELNDQFIKYFSERYPIRRATDFVEENLTGTDVIEYSLKSGEPGGISDPGYLATVEAFANWYRRQPKVVHVNTITDTMKRLNKNLHKDDAAYYTLPQRRDLAAQYLLLYEMSLPFGLDLNDRIDVDKSATRLSVTLAGTNTRELREMDARARAWLQANAPETMFTYGSGLSIIWAHISERNINSMLGASFGALGLISVILMFALRSFKLGAVSVIPNLTPALMAFGAWGIVVGRAGLGLSIIAAMTIGVVVDDTVHFMSKYLRARREHGMSPSRAIHYSFDTVGTALWVTTLALVSGFLVLSVSGYKMNSDMGLMAALTIALAFAMDVLFLPALLMKLEGQPDEASLLERGHISAVAAVDGGSRGA